MTHLIDTNVVIDYLNHKLPLKGMQFMNRVIDKTPYLSVITKIELLRFNTPDLVYQTLSQFVEDSTVIGLNNIVVDRTIYICKKSRIKLPDAIIAATALVEGFTLITRNLADFRNIQGLKVIDPHEL